MKIKIWHKSKQLKFDTSAPIKTMLTWSGSEDPEPRSPEVAEPPLPGEDEEREEP